MRILRLVVAAVGAIIVLSTLAAVTSARTFSSSSQTLRATWTRLDYTGGFGTIECEATLEGSFHARTIAKVSSSLIGYITRASVSSPCRRGGATILSETLPWHVTYGGFGGTLPNISSVRSNVIGFALRIREPSFGVTCLLRSAAASPFVLSYVLVAGVLTSAVSEGTIACGSFSTRFSGTSTALTVLNSTTRITVTLI